MARTAGGGTGEVHVVADRDGPLLARVAEPLTPIAPLWLVHALLDLCLAPPLLRSGSGYATLCFALMLTMIPINDLFQFLFVHSSQSLT